MLRATRGFGALTCLLPALLVGCAEPSLPNPVTAVSVQDALPKPTFNADGSLNRPTGYREWVYVGTPVTPNSLNPPEAAFPEFHNVYIHPDDYAVYRDTGEFPDGTVLVKELVLVGAEQAVSGNGYFQGEFTGLEATVKDAARLADEPGNWAYYSWGHSYPLAETAQAFPTAACNSCHEVSAADDFVFTQYYPVLRAAKGGQQQVASGEQMEAGNSAFDAIERAMSGALDDAMEANAPAEQVESVVPTENTALYEYLSNGGYKSFAAQESDIHASRGPHTGVGLPVRVYMDPLMDASMAAGTTHPTGAAIVKEMYDADRNLAGWAVMVKTQDDSAGGNGWFWYEITSTENIAPVASGNGVPLCFGCHGAGRDYVLSTYPLGR